MATKTELRLTALEEQLSQLIELLSSESNAPAPKVSAKKSNAPKAKNTPAPKVSAKARKANPVITGEVLKKKGHFTVTQYSPNSLALYGAGEATKPFAPALKRAGGKWGWQDNHQCWWFSAKRHTPSTILRLVK